MIAWRYIDKYSATIAATKDYISMKNIIMNTPDDIKETYENLLSVGSINYNDLPKINNPNRNSEKIINSIEKISILEEKYKYAIEYMNWFEQAWNSISEMSRTIIEEFYMKDSYKSGANKRLQSILGYSERQVERLRREPILNMSVILFGK